MKILLFLLMLTHSYRVAFGQSSASETNCMRNRIALPHHKRWEKVSMLLLYFHDNSRGEVSDSGGFRLFKQFILVKMEVIGNQLAGNPRTELLESSPLVYG